MIDSLYPEPVEVEGLGTLTPLTLAQMVDLRFAIREDLNTLACHGLDGADRSTASSAIAVHVANMGFRQQAFTITESPRLFALAAAMMLGNKDWVKAPMFAATKLERRHWNDIEKAILSSYGFRLPEPGEAKQEGAAENPSTAADSTT
jgi:hypothetical protein